MSNDVRLAYTVHHKGRKYRAGMSAAEIGAVAGEIGDHAWEGGTAPTARQVPKQENPDAGTGLGAPIVPTPSGLPGGPNPPAGEADATSTTEADGGAGDGGSAPTGDGGSAPTGDGDGDEAANAAQAKATPAKATPAKATPAKATRGKAEPGSGS